MATRTYATPTELAAYPGGDQVSGNVDAQLRLASAVVDELLVARVYPTDADGYPTDAGHRQSMADAVCAIVVEADATDATAPGSTASWDSVAIGTVKLAGRTSSEGATTVLGMPVPLAARIHLLDVGRTVVVGP